MQHALPLSQPRQRPIRVVVPAYHAGPELNSCLDNILTELDAFPGSEVMVISYKSKFTPPDDARVHVVVLTTPLNAGEARNFGAADCGDKILVFVDADVLIEKGSMQKLVLPIFNGRSDAAVGNYTTHLPGYRFFRYYKNIYIHETYAKKGLIENEFWTAYSAIKGDVFHAVGGFSDAFKLKGGEDTEIGIRLTAAQHSIYAVSDALGKHLKDYTLRSLIKNDFDKGVRTIKLALGTRVKLASNRHAKKSDQVAVFLACLCGLSLVAGIIFPVALLGLPYFFFAYYSTREKFLNVCAEKGKQFFIECFATALLLDVVRAVSLVTGVVVFIAEKIYRRKVARNDAQEVTMIPAR